jgi:hypothetical protein
MKAIVHYVYGSPDVLRCDEETGHARGKVIITV